ncbi:hypothetical protein ATK36_6261 [Amycolatopsis sulphurea]|uniref:Uncharacterized protein n=1 Tax=Amycolatopsis sulphurea TaxID=76022 RepID=A0A2A9FJR0_9PSEU|nr:hypothetical protein [Amycolatopsis sulphurea]PFG50996.1 hypothetical protein ATK36_6261 [Amycolatopsis sulphurea]
MSDDPQPPAPAPQSGTDAPPPPPLLEDPALIAEVVREAPPESGKR